MHEFLITATSAANKVQKIQILYGTGSAGAATIATEFAFYLPATGKSDSFHVRTPRIAANNKVWVKAHSETDNATIDFIVGIHTYEG